MNVTNLSDYVRRRTEDELYEENIWPLAELLGLTPKRMPKGTPKRLPKVGEAGLVYHVKDSRRSFAGWPDLTLLNAFGCLMFRELKMVGRRLSAAQQAVGDLLLAGGHDFAVWTPADWPDRIGAEMRAFRRLRPALRAA